MPWTEILGGATGGLAVLIIAALFLGKLISENMADAAAKLVEARLKRAPDRTRGRPLVEKRGSFSQCADRRLGRG
jgi:hypothetical protein